MSTLPELVAVWKGIQDQTPLRLQLVQKLDKTLMEIEADRSEMVRTIKKKKVVVSLISCLLIHTYVQSTNVGGYTLTQGQTHTHTRKIHIHIRIHICIRIHMCR